MSNLNSVSNIALINNPGAVTVPATKSIVPADLIFFVVLSEYAPYRSKDPSLFAYRKHGMLYSGV